MTVKIKTTEQALLETMAGDTNDINGNGLFVQPLTPIAITTYPIENYATTVPPLSPTETKVKDGMIGLFAPIVRYMGPLMGQTYNLSPAFSVVAETTLLTYTLSENLEVPRMVEISAQGSAYSTAVTTSFSYTVKVNGVASPAVYKYFFDEANSSRCWSGSWIVTLAPGANTITLVGSRGSGAGTITLNPGHFVNMTFRG